MRCDTIRELFDDLDRERLPGALADEIAAHVAACPDCASARDRFHNVVTALGRLPTPALPPGFEAALLRRLQALHAPGKREGWRAFAGFRYALAAAAGALATAGVLYALLPSLHDPAIPASDQPTGSLLTVVMPQFPAAKPVRVAKDRDGLRVATGDDVAVTVSVQAPEPVEGAKVYVVLPMGLVFSPDDHPDQAGKRVLSFVEDLDEDPKDIDFTVRGEKSGRWDVTALVENGDSIEVAGTTIVVAGKEEEL